MRSTTHSVLLGLIRWARNGSNFVICEVVYQIVDIQVIILSWITKVLCQLIVDIIMPFVWNFQIAER